MTKNAIVKRMDFTPESQYDTIKNVICKNASDAEFQVFAFVWKATELNPMMNELYWLPKIGPYISYKGYLKMAQRSNQYDGKEHEFLYEHPDGVVRPERSRNAKLFSCIARVYRKDRRMPETFEALYSTYKKNNPAWGTYPELMLKIKAERGALMHAFPVEKVDNVYEIDEDTLPNYEKVDELERLKEIPTTVTKTDRVQQAVLDAGTELAAERAAAYVKKRAQEKEDRKSPTPDAQRAENIPNEKIAATPPASNSDNVVTDPSTDSDNFSLVPVRVKLRNLIQTICAESGKDEEYAFKQSFSPGKPTSLRYDDLKILTAEQLNQTLKNAEKILKKIRKEK